MDKLIQTRYTFLNKDILNDDELIHLIRYHPDTQIIINKLKTYGYYAMIPKITDNFDKIFNSYDGYQFTSRPKEFLREIVYELQEEIIFREVKSELVSLLLSQYRFSDDIINYLFKYGYLTKQYYISKEMENETIYLESEPEIKLKVKDVFKFIHDTMIYTEASNSFDEHKKEIKPKD